MRLAQAEALAVRAEVAQSLAERESGPVYLRTLVLQENQRIADKNRPDDPRPSNAPIPVWEPGVIYSDASLPLGITTSPAAFSNTYWEHVRDGARPRRGDGTTVGGIPYPITYDGVFDERAVPSSRAGDIVPVDNITMNILESFEDWNDTTNRSWWQRQRVVRRQEYLAGRYAAAIATGVMPILGHQWMYDPEYGIIHAAECVICYLFVSHRQNATNARGRADATQAQRQHIVDALNSGYNDGLAAAGRAIASHAHPFRAEDAHERAYDAGMRNALNIVTAAPRRIIQGTTYVPGAANTAPYFHSAGPRREGEDPVENGRIPPPPPYVPATDASAPVEGAAPPNVANRQADELATNEPVSRMFAMRAQRAQPAEERDPDTPRWVYDANIRRNASPEEQPQRDAYKHQVLAADIVINGKTMFALFDSGSTTNGISPEAVHVAHVDLFELAEPMTLQLGCVGSKSRINYGTNSEIQIAGKSFRCYLDVANIDHYDVILGTPFLS